MGDNKSLQHGPSRASAGDPLDSASSATKAYTRLARIGPHRLYLGDSAAILPTLGHFDALVTDPPYGIGYDKTAAKNGGRHAGAGVKRTYADELHDWDSATCDELVYLARRKSNCAIIWGGNYYDLPPASRWLIWDKLNGSTDFADAEMAWTDLGGPVRVKSYLWNGMLTAPAERGVERIHKTQKPEGIMSWCMTFLPETAVTVLGSFMGSGTTGVAAMRAGLHFTGIEREVHYFEHAVARLRAEYDKADLFK